MGPNIIVTILDYRARTLRIVYEDSREILFVIPDKEDRTESGLILLAIVEPDFPRGRSLEPSKGPLKITFVLRYLSSRGINRVHEFSAVDSNFVRLKRW